MYANIKEKLEKNVNLYDQNTNAKCFTLWNKWRQFFVASLQLKKI